MLSLSLHGMYIYIPVYIMKCSLVQNVSCLTLKSAAIELDINLYIDYHLIIIHLTVLYMSHLTDILPYKVFHLLLSH